MLVDLLAKTWQQEKPAQFQCAAIERARSGERIFKIQLLPIWSETQRRTCEESSDLIGVPRSLASLVSSPRLEETCGVVVICDDNPCNACVGTNHFDYRPKLLELIRVLALVWIVNSVPLSS